MTSAATFKTYFTSGVSSAADDITIGDAAVTLSTSSGNITIDATANDTDIIFKGTDDSSDITMLTLDGSDAGSATFNDKVIVGDGKLVLNSTAVTSTAAELNLLDGVSGISTSRLNKISSCRFNSNRTKYSWWWNITLTSSGIITANAKLDLNGTELILDADADTSITADTDDQIDIRLAGADDFQITANTFTILSGSTIAIAAGGGITNAGSMSSDITSTGKALVFGF